MHGFEKKNIFFKKQNMKKTLHTKNHVLIQFTHKLRNFCVLGAILKSTNLKKKFFSKNHDF